MPEYTEAHEPTNHSEVVDVIVYNENTQELCVVLLTDEVYKYAGVEKETFKAFRHADSPGAYYNTVIKREHGPSDHLGSYPSVDWELVDVHSPISAGPFTDSTAALGTPKGLTYAEDAVVTNRDEEQPYVTLGAGVNEPATGSAVSITGTQSVFTTNANSVTFNVTPFRTHVVTFTIEGMDGEREYQASTQDVDAAVDVLNAYASQLGLTVKVLRVVVHFD